MRIQKSKSKLRIAKLSHKAKNKLLILILKRLGKKFPREVF